MITERIVPNLGYYRKSAKELKRKLAQGDAASRARLVRHHPKYVGDGAPRSGPIEISLADAQLVLARENGFSKWGDFKTAVEKALVEPRAVPVDGLMAAIKAGELEAARALCSEYPEIANAQDAKNRRPLVEACDRGLLELARLLLDHGADPLADAPLLAASHAGPHKRGPALDVVGLLLERGVPYDVFAMAALGRTDDLRKALPGVDLDARGPDDSTALFLAASNGHVEAVRLLLEAGAAPNATGRGGRSLWQQVMLHVWSAPHREIARLLLDRGAECSFNDACRVSHFTTVRKLLAGEPALRDRPGPSGATPLELAVLAADIELASLLLEAGAQDPKGQGRALVTAKPQVNQSFGGGVFRNCDLRTTNFNDCAFRDATFSNVDMSGIRIDNVNLSGARIDNAAIKGLTIYGIDVEPLLVKELERRAARKNE